MKRIFAVIGIVAATGWMFTVLAMHLGNLIGSGGFFLVLSAANIVFLYTSLLSLGVAAFVDASVRVDRTSEPGGN